MKYEGEWSNGEIRMPVSFTVEDDGRVVDISPADLSEKLYGAAYVAHVNYQNLLRGCLMRIPNSIDARPVSSLSDD